MSLIYEIIRNAGILNELTAVVRKNLLNIGHLLSATLLQLILLCQCLIVLPFYLSIIGPVLLILSNYI